MVIKQYNLVYESAAEVIFRKRALCIVTEIYRCKNKVQ